MVSIFFRLTFALLLVTAVTVGVNAQSNMPDASTNERGSKAKQDDLPKNIKESLAKSRIENEKKEFQELIQRGEETLKLTEELEKSFSQNNKLSAEDQKKLDRLEKLAKKIRKELGGDSDEDSDKEVDKPSSMQNALQALQNNSTKLFEELKKATRHSISVIAIQSSNSLLKAVRFLRFSRN